MRQDEAKHLPSQAARSLIRTIIVKAFTARDAAIKAVDENGPDGYYVVKDVKLIA